MFLDLTSSRFSWQKSMYEDRGRLGALGSFACKDTARKGVRDRLQRWRAGRRARPESAGPGQPRLRPPRAETPTRG